MVQSGSVALLHLLSLLFVFVLCHNQFADLRRFAAHAVKRLALLQVHLLLGCSSHLQGPDIWISFIFMFTTFETNRVFLLLVPRKKQVSGAKGTPIEISA